MATLSHLLLQPHSRRRQRRRQRQRVVLAVLLGVALASRAYLMQ